MYNIQVNERGQITIPKELRDKANIYPKDNLTVDLDNHGRLVIVKKDFFADLDELIKKDLISQGYTESDFESKIPDRKKELAQSLLKMADESKKEIDSGNYSTLHELKEEYQAEGK